MARYSSMLLVSSGAAILLSALLLEAAASAPGFMRPTCTTPLGLLQCRGGEAASISKAAGAAMAAAAVSEQHNASTPGGAKGTAGEEAQDAQQQEAEEEVEEAVEGEGEFHDAAAPAETHEAESAGAADAAAADAADVQEGLSVEEDGSGGDEEGEVATAAAAVEQELSGPEAVRRRRAQEAGGDGGKKAKKDKYNAKMQWVITARMKRILVEELHYTAEEVEVMMPDVAAVVINKHLERPKQGMPPEWRRDFHLRSRGLKGKLRWALARMREARPAGVVKCMVAVVGGVGAVALAKGWRDARVAELEEDEYEWVEMTPWEELVDSIQARVPALPWSRGGGSASGR